jgi:hypothetical protein
LNHATRHYIGEAKFVMFNVSDNLKKLMNKKTDSVFIEDTRSKTIQEQSKEFFSKIYALDLMKEDIYIALLAKEQINILLIGPPTTSKTIHGTNTRKMQ